MSYFDKCNNCMCSFNNRHYTWAICLKCHKSINKREYIQRKRNNGELL